MLKIGNSGLLLFQLLAQVLNRIDETMWIDFRELYLLLIKRISSGCQVNSSRL